MSAVAVFLDQLIDYAGLFPPAKLPMAEAVRNYADYVAAPHRAALGRFIVPISRLPEFEEAFAALPASIDRGWRLSVIAGNDPAADWESVRAFNIRQSHARIVSVETKASTPAQALQAVEALPPIMEAWVEVSPAAEDLPALIEAIKATGRGAKLRTGGITADAFPAPSDVVRFIGACHHAGIVFKATAGLHHPLRGDYRLTYEPGSPHGRMFGFLNVFLAATLLHTGGRETDALALLEDSDPKNFHVLPDAIAWRAQVFSSRQLRTARQQFCRSFGSCSFTEPIEGLQELHWL